MLTLKSNREIALMKEAGRIVELAHIAVRNAAKPGVSTLELDKIAYDDGDDAILDITED